MKFKTGDKVVCTCGNEKCRKFYTVSYTSGRRVYATSEDGVEIDSILNNKATISRELYDSPLYKALK